MGGIIKMKATVWIILGLIGIIVGIVLPEVVKFQVLDEMQSVNPSAMRENLGYLAAMGVISQIAFWGGMVSVAFGFVKYYKDKK